MYGKLENGVLIYAPQNFQTSEGKMILNFNQNISMMAAYGYKEVLNKIPTYDSDRYIPYVSQYIEDENVITIVYDFREKQTVINMELEDINNRLKILENQNIEQQIILSEEVNKQ